MYVLLLSLLWSASAGAADPLPSEPSLCVFEPGPLSAVAALKEADCAADWLLRARAYVKAAGKPGAIASQAEARRHREQGLKRLEELSGWLAGYKSGAPASPFDAQRRPQGTWGEPKSGELEFSTATKLPAAKQPPAIPAPTSKRAGFTIRDIDIAGCAFFTGAGRTDMAFSELRCVVSWLLSAQERFQKGGKPTEWTNKASADDYRAQARKRLPRLKEWFSQVRLEEAQTPQELAAEKPLKKRRAGAPKSGDLDFK